jgi:hypothetical protein
MGVPFSVARVSPRQSDSENIESVQNLGEGPRQHRRLGLKGWDCAKLYLVVVTLRSPLWLGKPRSIHLGRGFLFFPTR